MAKASKGYNGKTAGVLTDIQELSHCNKWFYSLSPEALAKCPECHSPDGQRSVQANPTKPSKPRSLCVKATVGKMYAYRDNCMLHVGISNADGSQVVNFDERGLHSDPHAQGWSECLSIPLVGTERFNDAEWNESLGVFCDMHRQMGRKYHSLNHNCYDLVIQFLNFITYEDKDTHTKDDIVVRFVASPVELFEAYIGLFRRAEKNGLVVVEMPDPN